FLYANSPRERKFVVKGVLITMAYVIGFLALLAIGNHVWHTLKLSRNVLLWGTKAAWGIYLVGLVPLIIWFNRRQKQIKIEDGTYVDPQEIKAKDVSQASHLIRRYIYWNSGGAIFGCLCWLYPFMVMARDWLTAVIVSVCALALFVISTRACIRNPKRYWSIAIYDLLVLAALNFVIVNLRWDDWMPSYRQSAYYQAFSDLSLWIVNALMGGVFAFLLILLALMARKNRAG
ncbi:MAG: hypothetical protein ACYTF1_23435, partial [Planctomycetota bacterium]